MREERKLEKAIRRDGEQTQSDILDELKRRYPQYTKQSVNKQPAIKRRRIAVFSSLAAVAVCLAIILPCALLLPNRLPSGGGRGDIFYCSADEYKVVEYEYSFREYGEKYNGNILYFDWYETTEDFNSFCFKRKSDDEVLGLQESAYNPGTDEFITISVTKTNVYLSEFDGIIDICKNEQNNIKYGINKQGINCIFENGEYRYFIQIEAGQDENRLFDLVGELLQKK